MARKGRHPRRQGRAAARANRPTAAGRTYIDHNMGTVVKDAFVVPDDPDGLVADMRRVNDDPGTTFHDIDAADARKIVPRPPASVTRLTCSGT
jgi:hypothetical protein